MENGEVDGFAYRSNNTNRKSPPKLQPLNYGLRRLQISGELAVPSFRQADEKWRDDPLGGVEENGTLGGDGEAYFDAGEATSFWKRGSLRSGSNIGSSRSNAAVIGGFAAKGAS